MRRAKKEVRETKIIAAGANPALLGYVSGICPHKGVLEEDVAAAGRQQHHLPDASQVRGAHVSGGRTDGQTDTGTGAGSSQETRSGTAEGKGQPCPNSSRETDTRAGQCHSATRDVSGSGN